MARSLPALVLAVEPPPLPPDELEPRAEEDAPVASRADRRGARADDMSSLSV